MGEGPACGPGIQARPSSVAVVQSEGRADMVMGTKERSGRRKLGKPAWGRFSCPKGMIPCPRRARRVYAVAVRALHSDRISILLQAIAIAWPVSVVALSAHTPQPTPPVEEDDDDEQRRGGGSGGGNIDPDHDDSGPDDDGEDEDDEGDTLWTRSGREVGSTPPARRP